MGETLCGHILAKLVIREVAVDHAGPEEERPWVSMNQASHVHLYGKGWAKTHGAAEGIIVPDHT